MADQEHKQQSPRRKQVGRLASLVRVRREAAKLYRASRCGEVSAADTSRLASVLALIAAILRDVDLERRIVALEETTDAG